MSNGPDQYPLKLELVAMDHSPQGVLDPEKEVPFAVLGLVQETLVRLSEWDSPETDHARSNAGGSGAESERDELTEAGCHV